METVETAHKMDIGRLIAAPIFTFLLFINVGGLYKDFTHLVPLDFVKILRVTHHFLIICFYALVILIYFLRRSAVKTDRSIITNSIAISGTFTPFTMPFLTNVTLAHPGTILAANLIMVIGILFSIYALAVLGRSFSIIPQARKLVQNGPYRWVRHPLYVGEVISLFGIVLVDIKIIKMIVFLFVIACQIYRALHEEKLLARVFPEYKDYSSRTARFIPGFI